MLSKQRSTAIVFLRICEDRGLEPFGALRDAASRSDIYTRLCELFLRADGRYDSDLSTSDASADDAANRTA